jgi:hypothetical protein
LADIFAGHSIPQSVISQEKYEINFCKWALQLSAALSKKMVQRVEKSGRDRKAFTPGNSD